MKQNAIPILLFFSKWVLVTTCQELDVLLTVHHGTLINQHKLDTLFLVCLLEVTPLHVLGVTHPSSGGSAQVLFGVIMCAGCVLSTCSLR
jgi:hypothetical protein